MIVLLLQWGAYGQSKTANILHALEFNRRHAAEGIIALSLHPGVIETELWRHAGLVFRMNKTVPQGAATSVFCCVSPTVKGGYFYNDCQEQAPNDWANDAVAAATLWELSLAVTSEK